MTTARTDFGVHHKEAIAVLKAKAAIPTKRWDDAIGSVQSKGFTIAGATKLDIVNDFHEAVLKALSEGKTIGDFLKDFDRIVEQYGWSYNGSRGWRARLIFNTNMRTSRMAGLWKKIQANKAKRPYLMYVVVDDNRLRPAHARWASTILPVDHKWWRTHYPPNGWGCRCTVRSLSDSDMKRRNLTVTEAPKIEKTERINRRTGEVYGDVPDGIDTGWDYNVGAADIGSDISLGDKISLMPKELKESFLSNEQKNKFAQKLMPSWSIFFSSFRRNKSEPQGGAHSVGLLSAPQLQAMGEHVEVSSPIIIVPDTVLSHLQKDRTRGGVKSPEEWIKSLPLIVSDTIAILYDTESSKGEFLFVLKKSVNNRKGRVIVRTGYRSKKASSSAFNTITSVAPIPLVNLKSKRYKLIWGEL